MSLAPYDIGGIVRTIYNKYQHQFQDDIVSNLFEQNFKSNDFIDVAKELLASGVVTNSFDLETLDKIVAESEDVADDGIIYIPLFDKLGISYRVVDTKGDGKCFFHAICLSLGIQMEAFFDALKQALKNDVDYERYPDSGTAMFALVASTLRDRLYQEDRRANRIRSSAERNRIVDNEINAMRQNETLLDQFYTKWANSADYVDQQTMFVVAKLLLQNGIGLAIVHDHLSRPPHARRDLDVRNIQALQNEPFHQNFAELPYMQVINDLVVSPAISQTFHRGRATPIAFPPLTHFLCLNTTSGSHYRATAFRCKDEEDEEDWTFLPCLRGLENMYRPRESANELGFDSLLRDQSALALASVHQQIWTYCGDPDQDRSSETCDFFEKDIVMSGKTMTESYNENYTYRDTGRAGLSAWPKFF